MPKIRVRNSKPNTGGSYNQGRKLGKERNHNHQPKTTTNTKGQTIEYCDVSGCKKRSILI